jgi:NADH-quinone oxidoreductase subunit G
MRLKPRFNQEVNKWWICDEGRYGYRFIDQNRILKPMKKVEDKLHESSWGEAVHQVASLLGDGRKVGVIVSTDLTNEDLWVTREIFEKHLQVRAIAYAWTKKPGSQDNFLIKPDKTPNTRGARALGFQDKVQEVFSLVTKGEIKTLIVFGHNLIELWGRDTAEKIRSSIEHFIVIGSNRHDGLSLADWVLPAAVYAEKEGTFTNFQGRVQKILKAFPVLGESRGEWEMLKVLGEKLGFKFDFESSQEIFNKITQSVDGFQGMSYEKLGSSGLLLHEKETVVETHVD